MNDQEKPSETAVAAAYQVTCRWFTSEQQLIWRRTAFFLGFQGLVAAALYYFRTDLHVSLSIILPGVGLAYAVCWHFSMSRSWAYHTFLIRMMREQEAFLGLGDLGGFSRGKEIVEGGKGKPVAGENTRFPVQTIIFRAKVLADATTWLFVLVYLVSLILGFSKLKFTG